jgi:hypothetical protein
MKINSLLLKSLFSLIGLILINSYSFAQKPNPKELPSISFTATKNVIVLDETKVNANIVKLESEFNLMGKTKVSILWSISGVEGKDWKIISGTLNDKTIERKLVIMMFILKGLIHLNYQLKKVKMRN